MFTATPLSLTQQLPSARVRRNWLLRTTLAVACAGLPGAVFAANCSGVAEWNPVTQYKAGDTLQKGNVLYQAKQLIWNAPPDHPGSAHWYTNLGACDAGGENLPPSIALSTPYEGDSFSAGSNIDISADAHDSDGSISRVEFFRGSTSLGVDDSAPFALTWSNAVAGEHALTATATDNQGATTTSAAVNISVTAPSADTTPPSVPTGLSSPLQTASSIHLLWNAASDNPGGSGMAGYTVFRNGTPVGSPAGTGFTDSGLSAGTAYAYTVWARDQAGNHSALSPEIKASTLAAGGQCSGVEEWNAARIYRAGDKLQKSDTLYQAKVDIWNAPPDSPATAHWYTNLGPCGDGGNDNIAPTVAVTAPSAGASFPAGSSITVSADASDSDGSIAKVEFFRGEIPLGTDSSAPYSVNWGNASAGSHVLKAVATDNDGAQTSSATVTITVTPSAPDTTAPTVPAGLASPSQTARSISLAWQPSSDNEGGSGMAGYDVYRDGGSVPVGSPAGTSFTDSGREPGTTYSYTVRARDNAGNGSAHSAPISASTKEDDGDGGAKRVIGYFAQWGIYGRDYNVKNIDSSGSAAKLTHINYAFGNVRDNRCQVGHFQTSNPDTGEGGDPFADYSKQFYAYNSVSGVADSDRQALRGSWNQLKQLKAKHPNIKVLISLGGWTYSRGFSEAAKAENREAFVASCIDAYIKGNLPVYDNAGGPGAAAGLFDGIDIDWEYPVVCGLDCGKPEDNANFTALMAEFRRQLDAVRPGLLLTAAVGGGIDKIRETDPASYHPYLDYINVMTYDFHGAWAAQTNHHSGLFASPKDPSTGDIKLYNSNDAIEAFISRGVPASKLNLGIGFYGRGWTNVPNIDNGLYQSGSAAAGTYEAGIEDWKKLKTLGWPTYTDSDAGATWFYNGTTFWSVDTPELIVEKMGYVKALNLGGAFFWEFSGDDAQGTLVDSIDSGLK